jgi:hypothetical protein
MPIPVWDNQTEKEKTHGKNAQNNKAKNSSCLVRRKTRHGFGAQT